MKYEKQEARYQILFYETEDGKRPVSDFIDSLDGKMAARFTGLMAVLKEKGPELRMPYSRPLGDGIFELRCQQGNNITRALYFFYVGKKVVVTNGFVKKTQKTPRREVKLAKARREEWLRRNGTEKEG